MDALGIDIIGSSKHIFIDDASRSANSAYVSSNHVYIFPNQIQLAAAAGNGQVNEIILSKNGINLTASSNTVEIKPNAINLTAGTNTVAITPNIINLNIDADTFIKMSGDGL